MCLESSFRVFVARNCNGFFSHGYLEFECMNICIWKMYLSILTMKFGLFLVKSYKNKINIKITVLAAWRIYAQLYLRHGYRSVTPGFVIRVSSSVRLNVLSRILLQHYLEKSLIAIQLSKYVRLFKFCLIANHQNGMALCLNCRFSQLQDKLIVFCWLIPYLYFLIL